MSADRKSGCLFKADSSEGAFTSRPDYRGELTGLHLHNNGETEGAARLKPRGGWVKIQKSVDVMEPEESAFTEGTLHHTRDGESSALQEELTCGTSLPVLTQFRQEVWSYISRKTHLTNNDRGHT